MSQGEKYQKSSGNIFRDIGCVEPEEKLAKAELIFIINNIIEGRGLNQSEAAKLLSIDQPKVSALKNGKLSGFSIERLFFFLRALDQHIDIVIHDESQKTDNMIHVAHAQLTSKYFPK